MSFLEIFWFLIASIIITTVIVIDPKNTVIGSGSNTVLSGLSSPSSRQNFVLNFNNILIATFFSLTLVLLVLV